MDYREEQLAAQVRAIVEAGETDTTIPERPLTLAELKELAISMGLNEEQWEALLLKAKKHLKLADDHLKARNYKDAITEGEAAIAINPYLINCNAILAKAYLTMWLEDHLPETREKAEYYARKELVVDPRDQQAIMILSTINKKTAVLEQDTQSRKKMFLFVAIGLVSIILLIILLASWKSSSTQANQDVNEKTEHDRIQKELIVAEEDVASKYDLIQVAIDQRNDMIPALFNAVKTSNVETAILDSTIQALRAQIESSIGEERIKLEASLDAKVEEAKNLVKQYGDATAVEKLLIQIEGSENRIAFEKKNYNEAVKNYNILVKQHADEFPQYPIKPYYNEQ
jgi:hypothetical protein